MQYVGEQNTNSISVEIRRMGQETITVSVENWATVQDCFDKAGIMYEDWTCGSMNYTRNSLAENNDVYVVASKQIKQG